MNAVKKKLRTIYKRNIDKDETITDVVKRKLSTNGYVKQKLTGGSSTQNKIEETVGSLCSKLGAELPEDFKWANADTPVSNVYYAVAMLEKNGALFLSNRNTEFYPSILKSAAKKGAKVIFADPEYFAKSNADAEPYPVIFVKNGMQKFYDYYAVYRNAYKGTVIGITGSVGKTTTKGYVNAVVKQKYPTFTNSFNYNSSYNVAFNIQNKTAPGYKAFIQEVGGGSIGAVANSSTILRPDIAIITNVMPHHLNNYKTIENVFDDKIYLVRNLMPGGTAVVNFDDERLVAFQYECKVVSFGIETELDVDYRAANIEQDGSILRMDIEHNGKSTKVESTITGKHNAYNILAAFAVGKIMDVKEEDIAKGIREYSASGTRQNVVQYGNNALFMDCYNVCNETIIKSVEILEEMDVPDGGRRIAIVGGENKLGASRVEITEELGRELAKSKVDRIVCFGSDNTEDSALNRFGDAPTLYKTLIANGFENTDLVLGFNNLVTYMEKEIKPNDAVLFKCIVYLNMAAAIDKVFGTGYCLSQKESRRGRKSKTIDGFTGIVLKDINEAYITDVSDKLLTSKSVRIPDEFDGFPVFALKKGLFAYSDVEKVDLGNSVQHIGIGAFRGCKKLQEVRIPDSVKYIRSGAFKECKKLKSVKLGAGTVQVDKDAFESWTEIQ